MEMKPARLPPELLDKQPRRLKQLQPGETGYIVFTHLTVNLRAECFVQAKAQLRAADFSTIEVRRDEKGLHVVIPADLTYLPRKVDWLSQLGLLPVASVTVGPSRKYK
jgi:hypothetical protein